MCYLGDKYNMSKPDVTSVHHTHPFTPCIYTTQVKEATENVTDDPTDR